MPAYVVTGAARGLGYEFLRQLSALPHSTVFGLVRNVSAAEQKVKSDGLQNVHILAGDIADRNALASAVAQVEKLVPSVDYLINNAAALGEKSAFRALSDFTGEEDEELLEQELLGTFRTNVIGVVNTINAFLPLIKKSDVKKVVTLTTGLADDGLTNEFGIWETAPYSISKAAVNTVVAKYNAKHGKSDGILFLGISPGVVDTGNNDAPPDNEFFMKFLKAYPHFTGPITPTESVKAVLGVVEKASASNEFAGAFVSHFGTKEWL